MERRPYRFPFPPRRIVRGAAISFALALGGCGGRGPAPAGPVGWCPEPEDGGESAGGVVTVALVDDVRTQNAPHPTNDGEAVVFRHLYEGLTDLDCLGRPVAALADSWSSPDGGRTWTFRIRADARFTDGGRVTGASVLEAWRDARRDARVDPMRFALWEEVRLRDISTEGDTVTLRFDEPREDIPRLLAAPEFRVYRPRFRDWPAGTRGRTLTDRHEAQRVLWTVEGDDERLRFAVSPEWDPRDAFLPDVDVLITRQRSALEHFAAVPGTRLTPLPWSRLYVITPTMVWPDGPPEAVLVELAGQIAPATARAADGPMLDALPEGPMPAPAGASPAVPAPRTLDAPAGDPDALALAERIASLWARDVGPVIVTPRSAAEVAWEMSSGSAPGILAIPRELPLPAQQALRLEALGPGRLDFPQALVCTRATLVTREDVAGVTWAYDGVPRFDTVHRRRPGP